MTKLLMFHLYAVTSVIIVEVTYKGKKKGHKMTGDIFFCPVGGRVSSAYTPASNEDEPK